MNEAVIRGTLNFHSKSVHMGFVVDKVVGGKLIL